MEREQTFRGKVLKKAVCVSSAGGRLPVTALSWLVCSGSPSDKRGALGEGEPEFEGALIPADSMNPEPKGQGLPHSSFRVPSHDPKMGLES